MTKQTTQNVFYKGRMMALWPAHLSEASGDTKKMFELIDPEVALSIGWALHDFDETVSKAQSDKLLSPLGAKQAQQNAAAHAVKRLAMRAKELIRAEERLRDSHAGAVEVPAPSMNDTLVDIALAQQLREQAAKATVSAAKLRASSERMRHAILRMPVELTGISQDVQDQIRLTFIAPSAEANFSNVKEAIASVRFALNFAAKEVVGHLANHGADVSDELDSLAKAGVRAFLPSPMGSSDPAARRAEIERRLGVDSNPKEDDSPIQDGIEADLIAWRGEMAAAGVTVTDVLEAAKRTQLGATLRNPAAQPA